MDLTQAYALYEKISEEAGDLCDKIIDTVPTSVPDAIALLETYYDDPPVQKVVAGLRAIAEKGRAL